MTCKSGILTAVFLSILFLPAVSQSRILDAEVRFAAQTSTIKELLDALGKAGGFTFTYGKDVPADRSFTVSNEKKSIREHLDDMFAGDSLTYIERGKKLLIVPSSTVSPASKPRQTIRGRILDRDTKVPLIGVNVLLGSDGPEMGTITDADGYFRFESVPVGRHDISCTYIGYDPRELQNLLVGSGKEVVLQMEMEESLYEIDEVMITHHRDKSKPVNNLAVVSGRSFSAYDVENYPGSLSDISRAAVSFPGVISPNDGQNHLVIRGNSPKGLQWRLEGIELPNLNHFSNIGASGGGVNVISNNMLASSDFLSGAFPAEYGNALSGVFDLRLRSGNNEKHEGTIKIGLIDSEVMAEGPLNRSTGTTYIAQYRYSTLKLMDKLGAELESVPDFQDLSFKIYHPTKKLGAFSLFGIGGLSHELGDRGYVMDSDMLTLGITNSFTVNPMTHVRTVVAYSARAFNWFEGYNMGSVEEPVDYAEEVDILDYTTKGTVTVTRKFNPRHTLKAGVVFEMAWDESFMGWHSDTLFKHYTDPSHTGYRNLTYGHTWVDAREKAATLQTWANWRYRIGESLVLNTGLHFIQFYLNNNFSLEPRAGLQWDISRHHSLSGGFGIHSRKESMTLYAGHLALWDGTVIQPNINLELAKARHYVLGYNYRISELLLLKAELYYQDLYDVPAYPFPPYFSTLNFDYGFEGNVMTNYGTGYNTGIEVSLERYMSGGLHFMVNGTLYDSRYRNKLGEWLHTKYNGTYASNGVIGKEFAVGKSRQHTITVSSRYILAGGMRFLPIDREASVNAGGTVRTWDQGFTEKASDYLRVDVLIKFRRNRRGYTGEWSLDLINILNRQNMLSEYWDASIRDFNVVLQMPFVPVISYRIQF